MDRGLIDGNHELLCQEEDDEPTPCDLLLDEAPVEPERLPEWFERIPAIYFPQVWPLAIYKSLRAECERGVVRVGEFAMVFAYVRDRTARYWLPGCTPLLSVATRLATRDVVRDQKHARLLVPVYELFEETGAEEILATAVCTPQSRRYVRAAVQSDPRLEWVVGHGRGNPTRIRRIG